MWQSIAKGILKFKYPLILIILASTAFMGWQASQVKLSYEFTRAIPTDNPKYIVYQQFRKQFGDDGNLLVIGLQSKKFFDKDFFNEYSTLVRNIKNTKGVTDVISVPSAINLVREPESEKLNATPIFRDTILTQEIIDSSAGVFLNLPFYQELLYNPDSAAWLMGISIDPLILNSPQRTEVVNKIMELAGSFEKKQGISLHLSGLPLIRTVMADRVKEEMKYFLVGSVLLSLVILLLFFRSISATLLSMSVVIIGVIWSVGLIHLMGYKITLLTALIPPLVVVIGIPNCIYFLNKFHSYYRDHGDKRASIIAMISKMGIVTLFCNIAAAIGFAVFALTKSEILKEFGGVAGINIMLLFFVSLILIPIALDLLPPPKPRHIKYLDNARLKRWLDRLERWSVNHRGPIYAITLVILVFSIIGITRLKSVGYIVDDLPRSDKIYTDLKFFENNFHGVMPLEIVVDARKKYGITRSLPTMMKIDSLTSFLNAKPYIGKPLTITEGLKFAKQAFFEGDSNFYLMPVDNDLIALRPYLSGSGDSSASRNSFTRLVSRFMDQNKQQARISVNMKDVGSEQLLLIIDTIRNETDRLFDSSKYTVQMTGSSITFLEGSRFIINGLKESIIWAFLLIALCMLYLFKSVKILLCSLIPNVIPLVITAGIMGWAGVALKPSTVLVFSVALGIAIDITIRFLVNYKQQLKHYNYNVFRTVIETIHSTGISIIYTSITLIAGFVIFWFSNFGGTKALGWLTSLTLITATIANLVLLPALLLTVFRTGKKE